MTWTRQQRTRYRTPSRLHSEAINDASWPQTSSEAKERGLIALLLARDYLNPETVAAIRDAIAAQADDPPCEPSHREALQTIQHHATHKTWTRDQIAQHAADALSR